MHLTPAKLLPILPFLLGTTLGYPWGTGSARNGTNPHSWGSPWSQNSTNATTSGGQKPFSFPLSNGFPDIDIPSSALSAIEAKAHGTLPNSPLPTSISDSSVPVWQLIAFNELFEVAFFSSLINNITTGVGGFQITDPNEKNTLLADLYAIQAQEQLHAIGANAVLKTFGHDPIEPCKYVFPSASLEEAIGFASTFTDVVLGTLQGAVATFGTDGDLEFLGLIPSIIGQEGEQNGFYRSKLTPPKVPSALPFLTASAGPFAFSALNQQVIAPGSCPSSNDIPVPIFGSLIITTPDVGSSTTNIDFTFTYSNSSAMADPTESLQDMRLVYLNQQNLPIVESLEQVHVEGNKVDFSAAFPYAQYEMNGLTIAALVHGSGPFTNASAVASATVFGPALIEIN